MHDLVEITEKLRAAGCVFAEEEAGVLASAASAPEDLTLMVARRAAGEPIERIVGWAEFCGLKIRIAPGVFVPRRRTEFLVEVARSLLMADQTMVDLCCGAGNIGAALVDSVVGLAVYATDIDPLAISCARQNMRIWAGLYVGDLDEPLPDFIRGRVDLVVANVPYVPTEEISLLPREARLYEAPTALDGGGDGLVLTRRAARAAEALLAMGGNFLIETSARQANTAAAIVSDAGLSATVLRNGELDATVVLGRKKLGFADMRRRFPMPRQNPRR